MGKIDKSLELAYQAYRIETEALGSFHPKIAWALITISSTLRAQKNFEKSDESLNQAIRIYQNSFDKPNAATASAIALLAHSKIEQKKFDEAQALAQQALMIRTAALGPQSGEVASSKNLLGRLARRRAQFTDALKLHSEALQIYEKRRNNDGIINSLIGMANSLTELHKPKLALPLIDRADGLRSGSGSPDQEADCQFSRAQALYAMPKSKAQHQQVRKLIDSARATYVRLGSSSRTDLELIDEWLKSKDLGPSEPQTAPLARP
jgi:tetratricopeptide (TPR) repeat protein